MYIKEDLEKSFQLLIDRAKLKRRTPLALSVMGEYNNPAQISMLPIGSDGMKTTTFLKNPDLHYAEILRKLRIHSENPSKPYHFRPLRSEKKFTAAGKGRLIYIYSLVDQIVLKTIHQELKKDWAIKYSNQKQPMDTAFEIYQQIAEANFQVNILKVDITKFFPSVDREILFHDLRQEAGIRPEVCRLIIAANSLENTTGVVTGGSLSTILSEYYLRNFKAAFPPEIGFHRFVDDMCLVIPKNINPELIKQLLIDELAKLKLNLSGEKSKIINPLEEDFRFLGINFIQGKPVISEEEIEHWKDKVQQDVYAEKAKLRLYKSLNPGLKNLPNGKDLQDKVWEQHYMGMRSRFYIKYKKFVQYFGPIQPNSLPS